MGRLERTRISDERIVSLREEIRKRERRDMSAAGDVVSTGCDALDELLPSGGLRAGSLLEWIDAVDGGNAAALSLRVGRAVVAANDPAVLIDAGHGVHPLALAALGFNLSRLVIVRPATPHEAIWSCEEALRCTGARWVWASLPLLSDQQFRRLQLAAESSGCIGFLLRSAIARRRPSWAEARWLVHPQPSRTASPRFRVDVIYSRGRPVRSVAEIQFDGVTGTVQEASVLHEIDETRRAPALPLVS